MDTETVTVALTRAELDALVGGHEGPLRDFDRRTALEKLRKARELPIPRMPAREAEQTDADLAA